MLSVLRFHIDLVHARRHCFPLNWIQSASAQRVTETASSIADHGIFHGTSHVSGSAKGILLASDLELSFWGGVDHVNGEVVDRYHPLSRQCLTDKTLAIPGGRGSCSESTTIFELIINGNGPKALIFERANQILAVGAFTAEELFKKTIPMIVIGPEDHRKVLGRNEREVHVQDYRISMLPPGARER
ncbi:uncharacterized protein EKO05_0009310 [Ascochyta rabiei]|uniref:uncharacterized protein n=1 Tax=Didymella rabiei TaxID=5454 RepID=UPI0021F9A147|nr:uncharacterized protein EKO05_0009310 [Ascochyta rabiei]UPX19033.1 hypothetical protein EKO05_0009310 [Ascochyta rabiei]